MRTIRRAAMYLLGGLVCNVLVVAAFAALVNIHEVPPYGTFADVDGRVCWVVDARTTGARLFLVTYRETDVSAGNPNYLPPRWLRPYAPSTSQLAASGPVEIACDARGWPMLSAWSQLERAGRPMPGTTLAATMPVNAKPRSIVGLVLPLKEWSTFGPVTHPRILPCTPILLGTVVNTVFYATIIFVCVAIWRGQIRLRRFRRGVCPNCSYDLRADYERPCPECGHTACRTTDRTTTGSLQ